jgi:SWI/SNF-related matrix-associated actin-dependent regulator of chromatin subfamily A member 5
MGKQRTAADFDATAPMLNMRELQGCTYGDIPDKAATEVLHLAGVLGPANGGSTDILAEWQALQNGKRRERAGRMETVHVVGVGKVNVLKENSYTMGRDMPNKASGRVRAEDKPQGRQLAGRDYAHEDRCLMCWKGPKGGKAAAASTSSYKKLGLGGTLRGCDHCPAAFHLRCLGMAEEDATGWGSWSCPHHSCDTCGRKAAAAGGLLFRCAVCPRAFCEDHLPAEALIMGECERFQALGAAHPKQGCYLLCKAACVKKSDDLGFGCGEASASAAAILGATGIDTTTGSSKRKAEPVSIAAHGHRQLFARSLHKRTLAFVVHCMVLTCLHTRAYTRAHPLCTKASCYFSCPSHRSCP